MVVNAVGNGSQKRWRALTETLQAVVPQVLAVVHSESDFVEVRFKYRDDGTTLAILKRFGDDGTPLVCFGTGYGMELALLSLEASVTGNNWRKDKYATNSKVG